MIELLQKAARNAGEVLRNYFHKGVTVSHKASFKDLLTEADTESQKIIYRTLVNGMIKKGYRKEEIGFIGEEKLNVEGTHKFIIDPLDGTSNFEAGLEYFCISIAYSQNNSVLSSLVFDPMRNIFYLSERSKGAYKIYNGKRELLKHRKKAFKNSLVITILGNTPEIYERQLEVHKKLHPNIIALRHLGATALDVSKCADNTFAFCINGGSSIWDIAAAKLIFEESGGIVTDWNGKRLQLAFNDSTQQYQFIACHPKLLPDVLLFFKD
ncbi:hypothetical protein HYW87_01020 [Candidatus Roizmanbacteria bacterium]|nr:hypothetical protein [Candidatus Roizmanbacteria bacterium]